jgi:hypothetical protein
MGMHLLAEDVFADSFGGYSRYIERLRKHVNKKVNVCMDMKNCLPIVVGGYPCDVLLRVQRETGKNPELFPHSVSLYSGMTCNLRNIFYITKDEDKIRFIDDIWDESLLYLNIPSYEKLKGDLEDKIRGMAAGLFERA